MNVRTGSVFSQLLSLIDRDRFARHVKSLETEKHSKGLKCWDQFVAMLFCQVAQCKSLREINQGLRSCEGKLQHLGLKEAPKRSTLSYANAQRDWRLYERVFYDMLATCQQIAPKKKFRFRNQLLSLDSTVIDLCASVFDWARFRTTKGAVKLHLLLDHDGYLPTFASITEGRVHDVKFAQGLKLPPGSIVAMDRGYYDFELFNRWTNEKVWFVSRLKTNADYYVVKENPVPDDGLILADEVIRFAGSTAEKKCPHLLRRIAVWVEEKAETIELLTNHHGFGRPHHRRDLQKTLANRRVRRRAHSPVGESPTEANRLRPRSLGGAVARKQDGEALRQHEQKGTCATHQAATCSERRGSLVTRNSGGRDGR